MLALLLAAVLLQDDPDLIRTRDGKEIECRVLCEGKDQVVYRERKKKKELALADVAEIQSVERSLREYVDHFAAIDPNDVAALSDLALFAESRFLPGEAHNTWIRILTLDPENEQAWTKLGGVKRRAGWQLKVRGRFLGIDELRERVSDWKHALELRTAHFLVLTDAAPELALNAAIDVERAYLTFYDVLGKPLDLWVFDEVPEVHIFSDPADYPTPPTPRDAWFSRADNTLYVNAHERRNRGDIVAEFVDALVLNAFRRTLDNRDGRIDPWAQEGLRQAFAAAARPDPGRVRFEFEAPALQAFRAQAADDEPLPLAKVLSAGLTSFNDGTDAPRYSRESYTLTYFLVFSSGGRYRPGYADYLRSSYLGKGGASNFFKALGVREKDLEAEWVAWVKETAGA